VSLGSVIPNRHAILTIAHRTTEGTITVDGLIAHDGRLSTGMFHLALPGWKLQAHFRAPADLLRLHIPQGLLAASGAHLIIGHPRAARLAHDPLIEQLALAIVAATAGAQPADRFVLDAMSTALLARAHVVLSGGAPAGPRAGGLVAWRLKRVADFVDARLEEPLSLADLAHAAGLSPMHFAAQFRLATGFTPREYLTRRRIDRARDLLRHSTLPIVEVALNVGFQTQAHFTTVFRRLSGAPPGRWREREAAHADHAALYLDASARMRGRVDG
jgi:AraC-like DNA-binding protein